MSLRSQVRALNPKSLAILQITMQGALASGMLKPSLTAPMPVRPSKTWNLWARLRMSQPTKPRRNPTTITPRLPPVALPKIAPAPLAKRAPP